LSWWKQIEPLSRRYRVISFDNRDAGDSAHATAPYSIGELAEDVAQAIEALDLGPTCVVGWSMGTFISQELAIRHPERIDKLILVAGSAGGATQNARRARDRGAAAGAVKPSRSKRESGERYPLLAAPGYMEQHPADLDRLVWSQSAKPMSFACYQRQLGAIMNWPGVGPRLPQVETPTLVIHGDVDPLVPYPNGELHRVADGTCDAVDGTPASVISRRSRRPNDLIEKFRNSGNSERSADLQIRLPGRPKGLHYAFNVRSYSRSDMEQLSV
jgi:pimeloyl-ACP methyl ester carboxylesterase